MDELDCSYQSGTGRRNEADWMNDDILTNAGWVDCAVNGMELGGVGRKMENGIDRNLQDKVNGIKINEID